MSRSRSCRFRVLEKTARRSLLWREKRWTVVMSRQLGSGGLAFVVPSKRILLSLLLATMMTSVLLCRVRRKILSGLIRIFPSRCRVQRTRRRRGIVFRLKLLSDRVRCSLFPLISRGPRSRMSISGSLRRIIVLLSVTFGWRRARWRIVVAKFRLIPLSVVRMFVRLILIPNSRLIFS